VAGDHAHRVQADAVGEPLHARAAGSALVGGFGGHVGSSG
jgi:hypothetical protein